MQNWASRVLYKTWDLLFLQQVATGWDEPVISIKRELFHIEKHVSKQKLQPETIENVYMRKKPIDRIIKMICTFPSMINLKMMQI